MIAGTLIGAGAIAGWKVIARPEQARLPLASGFGPTPTLPSPNPTLVPTINVATPVGWEKEQTPHPARGLAVHAFATGLDHPRWLYTLPNGDILVAETNSPGTDIDTLKNKAARFVMGWAGAGEKSPDRIVLLRDTNGDGTADTRTVFLDHLRSPFGMALVGQTLYVANADSIVAFPYTPGTLFVHDPGTKVADLPAGYNHHWTKNLLASPDGRFLYVTVGSNSNVAEHGIEAEEGRAQIARLELATGALTPYATGLRNPNGLGWEPQTGALWVAVNERDEIGSDLVPDYITSVRPGAFYGWPYSYYGQHVDTRVQPQRPDLVANAVVPDYALGPHTASLGLAFSANAIALPETWRHGVFISQHGSWNRRPKSGYQVIYIPFADGQPMAPPTEVLGNFLSPDDSHAHGRPVGLTVDGLGALLVADDVGGVVWQVKAAP
ncbi:MAG: sorbosone dehydrogenase family protein [Acetobacter papayae]|uniref:PQQ-dependent sugar dehydrogenase n=1 Tax=Acetobacter papayae TaxID=1076592 RepID=UPI0039EA8D13